MAAPLMTFAAPPEPPPVQSQTGTKSGADPTISPTIAPHMEEQLPPTQFPTMQKEFTGIEWGSFLVYPEIVLSGTYDDNIYGTPRNVVDDAVATLSPSVDLKSNWKKHALNFDAGADSDRYLNHNNEDVDDYWAGFDGRYDLSGVSNIFGGARFSHDHEDRSSPDALSASLQREPTRFDHGEAHLGFATGFGKFRIRAGGTYDNYDYQDGDSILGTNINNDYRDRDMNSLGARVSYVYSPNYEFFAQYSSDNRNYDNDINGQAFNRDSDGYRFAAGLKFRHSSQPVSAEVFAGTLHQEFDHKVFSDVDEPYFGALVSWRPSSLVGVTGFIDRSLEETTVFLPGTAAPGDEVYASSSLDTTYGFEVERKLTSKLTVNGRAAYTQSKYQGIKRDDGIIDASAGLRYYVSPVVFVGADLRVIDRESDAQLDQYSRNQLMLSLGYTPARKRDYSIIPEGEAGAPVAPGASGLFSGFYLGAQIGQGGLTTSTDGPGGDGGSGFDRADMGAIGESYGLFAGWGQEFGNWYLGVELDVSDSNAGWDYTKEKTGYPTAHVDKDISYGLNARVGYVLDGGLLYGTLGAVQTTFDTSLGAYQATTGAYDKEHEEDGMRFGVGLEIPASPSLFVRLDYSYTDYDNYDVPYLDTASTSAYESGDSAFSLGLAWRFGHDRPVATRRLPSELRGFYAGASVGHGTLATALTGTQMDKRGTEGPFDFSGDYANSGFTGGFFAGYGHTFNRFYVGLELEAEAANFGWYQAQKRGGEEEGGAGGRDFAVEKRGGYGAGLRLGYALDNGALLYGRVGTVQTRFNTLYFKGANANQWIDRTDEQNGTRIGLGAEIPASRYAFVRMDYSYTMYDSYGFVTGHDQGRNADDMKFDNTESLARLGLGFRF